MNSNGVKPDNIGIVPSDNSNGVKLNNVGVKPKFVGVKLNSLS